MGARARQAEQEEREESARQERLREALDAVRARCAVEERRASDPVEFVHRVEDPEDRELVALIASSMAFGNVKALRAKIADALERLGPDLSRVADDPEAVRARLEGWKHRVYTAGDLACLLVGARRVQREAGSLGAALAAEMQRTGTLREALTAWTHAIRNAGGLDQRLTRGAAHILADPGKGSAAKRLLLMLRWMVRPADGVDLGLWPIPPRALVIPVDVHIQKLGYNIGLTDRQTTSWKTAEEITAALRRFDPEDPVKYDFALCHLGMLQRCPSRRDPVRCEGCGVMPVCRHWDRRAPRGDRSARGGG
ncbi:TIGR02757 family protein [Chondromyces apiculatus]|uniref:TIGR02757 family protein n=1 Tax=Chondromyces apiculatus TaxID=51 RepID=UPI001E3A40FF|nr:TIGR02757 family protein [Chondromyces apiculatus]